MHTTTFEVDGERVVIHHNGDWSGTAYVQVDGTEVQIPGKLLVAIGKEAAKVHVRDEVVRALERL